MKKSKIFIFLMFVVLATHLIGWGVNTFSNAAMNRYIKKEALNGHDLRQFFACTSVSENSQDFRDSLQKERAGTVTKVVPVLRAIEYVMTAIKCLLIIFVVAISTIYFKYFNDPKKES